MVKRIAILVSILTIAAFAAVPLVADEETAAATKEERKAAKHENRRQELDATASETMDMLLKEAPPSKKLYDQAYGYAVFSSLKVAVGVSGGGGAGVAVEKSSGARSYMKMGTAGVGLGLGGRKYRIVFLFETEKAFRKFVDSGWQADTSANATAGTAGAGVASTFANGVAIYQFSDKGLMAQAEIAGTKYWKSENLN